MLYFKHNYLLISSAAYYPALSYRHPKYTLQPPRASVLHVSKPIPI